MATRRWSLGLLTTFLLSAGTAALPAFCAEDAPKGSKQTVTTGNDNAVPSGRSPLTWGSSRVQQARKEWMDAVARFRDEPACDAKSSFGKHRQELDALVSRLFTWEDMENLAVDAVHIPVASDADWPFAGYVIDNMIERFVAQGDRRHLVLLLAVYCPSRVRVNYDVAGYLAICGEKLTDPILVLGEAYTESKTSGNRARIVKTVRRGFAPWNIPEKDDGEFVGNAMQWYREHKGKITVNKEYCKNTMMGAPPYLDYPLFIKRDTKPNEKGQ